MFFSYNVPLSTSSPSTLLHQLASMAKSLLLPTFPCLKNARSAEIWAHSRTSEGHHQLHYDFDEIALAEGTLKSPLVSTVLFLETIEGGSPTLVCTKAINEVDEGDGKGGRFLEWNDNSIPIRLFQKSSSTLRSLGSSYIPPT